MKNKLPIIKKILNIFLIAFVVMFLLMVCLQRFTNNEISFFNFRMFTVASGSMAPEYEVGDVLIAKETAPEKIKVGDSITYLGNRGTFNGKVVTHSVTRIKKDKNGKYIFHTKGIANLVEDPPVYEEQVYGVIVWHPKTLSFIYKIINTKYGLFIFVVLPIFYVIGSEMLAAMLEKEEERRNMLNAKKQKEVKQEETKETTKQIVQEKIEEKEEPKLVEKETKIEVVEEEKVDELEALKTIQVDETPKKKTTTIKTTTKKTQKDETPKKKTTKTTTKKTTKDETPKKTTTTKKEPVKTTKKPTAKKTTTKKETT